MEVNIRKKIDHRLAHAVNSSVARRNFHLSSIAGIILCLLPRENIGGNKVPVLFRGQLLAFYAFVVSTVFTFTGSFTALMVGDNSKTARFCTLYSLIAMVSALSILAYVLLPD